MGLSKRFVTSAVIGLFALAAAPASAQHRGGGGARSGGMHGGGATVRSAGPRTGGRSFSAPRTMGAPRTTFARPGPSRFSPGFGGPRFSGARVVGPRTFGGGGRPAFANRGVIATRGAIATRSVVGVRGFGPRVIGSRILVAPHRFGRPFYAFRPRFSLGFGLFVGFPVAYPYYYGYPYAYPYSGAYPYPYPYPYPYSSYGYQDPSYGYTSAPYPEQTYPTSGYPTSGYPASTYPTSAYPAQAYPTSGTVGVQQGQDSGGVSFEISPSTATVYVDGTGVGSVAEFSPTTMPLTLTPGRHRIELRAAGYQTMAFDAEITVGQVIPYRGEMQPQR
jgi:hypothetical protein